MYRIRQVCRLQMHTGQACGSTLSSTSGVVESPRNYSESLNCSWSIVASPNMVIELNIETFNLKESGLCMSDSLTVSR